MTPTLTKTLLANARQAKRRAYSPYSKIRVGAAVLCKDGTIITGANMENASYGLTLCAERLAIFNAVFSGKEGFQAVALSSNLDEIITPCGACRQVLAEFCKKTIPIVCENRKGQTRTFQLAKLLPHSFSL